MPAPNFYALTMLLSRHACAAWLHRCMGSSTVLSPAVSAALLLQHNRLSSSTSSTTDSTSLLTETSSGAAVGHLSPTRIAPWRMRRSRASMNPVQQAAAVAREDLSELASLDGGHAASSTSVPGSGHLFGRPSLPTPPLQGPAKGVSLQQQEQPSQGARARRLGALQGLPVVAPSNESLSSALKRASKVAYSSSIKNEAEKERNRAARQMDTLMKELSVPFSNYVKKFPDPSKLHPFESALLHLTVSQGSYSSTLSKVDALRKVVQEVGKSYANKAANASNKQNALEVALEGCEAIERVYRKGAKAVDDLKEIAKKLRALPTVETMLPTLALVGAPNVGKSSLVRVLSSGIPEVCNYPFTTRSIKMGHFYLDGRKHQVTDTPGVMSRGDDERNKMELLTLAALDCLPTSVLFVMDLTEECGTSIADQWAIRRELRARYAGKPWIDAFSKCDMLVEELQRAGSFREQLQQQLLLEQQAQETGSLCAQPTTGSNSQAPSSTIAERHARLDQLTKRLEDVAEVYGDASEVAARLPHALAVSSLTDEGIEQLQAAIIGMYSKQAASEARSALAEAAAADAARPAALS
ncbi:hypothetical protein DUNSADRAFT_5060 [Dunaliella salina]|uniref:OBG-type G domain-containing protein n=1 Tax=Dunaliella salina TaxID=3046 RepID=A0ABQ7HAE1_DUNSA|nr:hypothetical protein DUNSADRAFT_5060 [Dunaliella salina]|eukprot:KAF5843823.1 hypothetical protein DUNSADRAFT_5060 [Dunaliella salina]